MTGNKAHPTLFYFVIHFSCSSSLLGIELLLQLSRTLAFSHFSLFSLSIGSACERSSDVRNVKILYLAHGATAIDVAFQIHKEVGLTMQGVETNAKLVQ
jgi:hypothetical protein